MSEYNKARRLKSISNLKSLSVDFVDDLDTTYENSTVRLRVKCKAGCGEIVSGISSNIIKTNGLNCKSCRYKKASISQTKHQCPKWFRARFNAVYQRCFSEESKSYKNYGGRGIKLLFGSPDEMWDHVSTLPNCSKHLTIDRTDNDGNYEAGNLRWASRKLQNQNQRKNKMTGIKQSNGSPNYQARIGYMGKEIYLGSFKKLKDAKKARKEAELLYGERL